MRTIIKINEEVCNGCGACVAGCHEGALQMIDGKAVLVSAMYCDGLGACMGDCPVNAIELETREAEAYDETRVMEQLIPKGEAVLRAHFRHLKDHGETSLLQQGLQVLKEKGHPMDVADFQPEKPKPSLLRPMGLRPSVKPVLPSQPAQSAVRRNFPIQLHLIQPQSASFVDADVLLAADCTAFACASFHSDYLKDKTLVIACPKLDQNLQSYEDKLQIMLTQSNIRSLTVLTMSVPCCKGLLALAKRAVEASGRDVPFTSIVL
ncbi:MAG TPA: 4Fe-4S dicluster domain-containing protein [Bacteroidales bacterium]|nr:4Fe-4S dicluster domain-containing protein [Bacteroidales bacterium]